MMLQHHSLVYRFTQACLVCRRTVSLFGGLNEREEQDFGVKILELQLTASLADELYAAWRLFR